ncbi:transcriptional regulator [Wenzhouxiangella sp. XN24]|uniref:transcriptional regulator n=1 Tax=Wenzhouxiangella sp. XN24 TaxID=2713569 RepID=UPI0019820906
MKKRTRAALDGVLAMDRLVHEPARLAILTVLSQAEFAEFGFLEMACRLSKGNLSSHLSKLEAGGLVSIEKRFEGKRPQTRAAITTEGRAALATYREQLRALIDEVPVNTRGGKS